MVGIRARNTLFNSIAIIGLFIFLIAIMGSRVSALSGSEFNPGRIIDDVVFYNSSTMSAAQIQQFLNSKVPVCDTNGTQPYAGTTRAAYGTSRGYPPPYTCLKDYSMSVPTVTNSGSDLCKGSITGGTKTAAQIIYDVSQACGINPQVMIVLLQKEQSLITDDWPWSIQYRSATGYGCPDTAPCDSEYYGFFNQVYQAAKAFRRYEANPTWYNYRAGRNNFIYYHPSLGACGGTNVFIQNQATASLYIYTPYQPNAAALNNLYGTGDGCSAYGNRNFWRMFNDWFGSTQRANAEIMISSPISISDTSPKANQNVTISYTVKNTSSYSVDSGVLWICGDLNGKQFGGGSKRKTLAPNEALTLSMTYTPQESGVLKSRACGNTPNGPGWVEGYPYSTSYDHRERWDWVNRNPIKISWAVSSSIAQPKVGETTVTAFEVTNTDNIPFDSGVLWICGDLNGKQFGGGSKRKTLAPNEKLTVSLPYTPTETGTLTIKACGNPPGGPGWVEGYPFGEFLDHRVRSYRINEQALKISWAINPGSTIITSGGLLNINYEVANTSTSNVDSGVLWICGDLNGKQFGGDSKRKTLAPNEKLTVSLPYTPTETGTLTIKACGNPPGGPGWVEGYPFGEFLDHRVRSYRVQ